VAGVVIAPMMVLSSVLPERKIQPRMLTQAFTWMNSASAAGIAAAAAVCGAAIDFGGAWRRSNLIAAQLRLSL
jgi:hypothetical protein